MHIWSRRRGNRDWLVTIFITSVVVANVIATPSV